MKWLRIVSIVVVVVLLGAWGAGSYLLGREEVPAESDYLLDVAELRELAHSIPGDLPIRVNYQQVASASLPRAGIFAGESFDPHPMTHGSYQIVYPDGFAMIDTAMGRATFDATMGGENSRYDAEGWAIVARALELAKFIVITHEHTDHIDGLVAHGNPEKFASRLRLNPEQLEYEDLPEVIRETSAPLDYERVHALAPGFVLIRAPGHTPGSQMIFVTLADGGEWLFLGDVAWHLDQIRNLHYRPRLVTDFFLDEDRDAVLAQFRTLYNLMNSTEINLVSSHDADQRDALFESGKMGRRFEAIVSGSNR